MITIRFKHATIELQPDVPRMDIRFSDGAVLPSCPNWRQADYELAERLGYGTGRGAVLRQWLEHDPLHLLLSDALGLATSPTLWNSAHPTTEPRRFLGDPGFVALHGGDVPWTTPIRSWQEEEQLIFAFCEFVNLGRYDLKLHLIPKPWPTLAAWWQLRRELDGEWADAA